MLKPWKAFQEMWRLELLPDSQVNSRANQMVLKPSEYISFSLSDFLPIKKEK